jgi:protein phosphatase
MLEFWAETDVGLVRERNEDNYLIIRDEDEELFVVADGMGGHRSGDFASRLCVDAIREYFSNDDINDELIREFADKRQPQFIKNFNEFKLIKAIKYSNIVVYHEARSNIVNYGMGTTVISILVRDNSAVVAHVGDSRLYRYRKGKIKLLTEDHSLLNEYLKMKMIRPEDVHLFPYRNIIVRAIGLRENIDVDSKK